MSAGSYAARAARAGLGLGPAALLLVRLYRMAVAPVLPRVCRFEPSCSAYAEEALRRHGFARALALILRRLVRCQPFHPGGHDPIP